MKIESPYVERWREAERASSVRKFTDVWPTLQKTAEGPLEPCHGWQADSV